MRISGTTGLVVALLVLGVVGGGAFAYRSMQETERQRLQTKAQEAKLETRKAEAREKEAEEKMQKITDKCVKEIDKICESKNKEIMEV